MHLAAHPPSSRTKEGRRTNYARYYPSALALDDVWTCWPVLRPVCLSVPPSPGKPRCWMLFDAAVHVNMTVLLQRTSLFLITSGTKCCLFPRARGQGWGRRTPCSHQGPRMGSQCCHQQAASGDSVHTHARTQMLSLSHGKPSFILFGPEVRRKGWSLSLPWQQSANSLCKFTYVKNYLGIKVVEFVVNSIDGWCDEIAFGSTQRSITFIY